jgi:hypothetical protein
MSREIILQYVNPWKFRREQEARRVQALRSRDGDACRRCRRPLRFDLPAGHDQSATIEQILPQSAPDGSAALDSLCLTHRRCNQGRRGPYGRGHRTDAAEERSRIAVEDALAVGPGCLRATPTASWTVP